MDGKPKTPSTPASPTDDLLFRLSSTAAGGMLISG